MSQPTANSLRPHELHCLTVGIALIHAGDFFEAHEVLEEAWAPCHDSNRRFLQAIIHVAVGCHHQANSNRLGMQRQFRKAIAKLYEYPQGHAGIDLPSLIAQLEAAIGAEPQARWDPLSLRVSATSL